MPTARILIAGETFMSYGTHVKGFNAYETASYEVSLQALVQALTASGHEVIHLPTHEAARHFPSSLEAMQEFDAIILSDIGADSLQLHPDTFVDGKRTPDRLRLLGEFVRSGGGLLMIGGYMSFSGYGGRARFGMTPLADVLPVTMLAGDDRVETPEGVTPKTCDHPIVSGLDGWPHFLGYNRLEPRPAATVVLTFDKDPLLVVSDHDQGRVAAFASDCAPHWGSPEFLEWDGYPVFWDQLIQWLTHKR